MRFHLKYKSLCKKKENKINPLFRNPSAPPTTSFGPLRILFGPIGPKKSPALPKNGSNRLRSWIELADLSSPYCLVKGFNRWAGKTFVWFCWCSVVLLVFCLSLYNKKGFRAEWIRPEVSLLILSSTRTPTHLFLSYTSDHHEAIAAENSYFSSWQSDLCKKF